MTIEALLTGLTEAVQKNTETALALIAQLKVTGENQERLIAGQAAAIDKVEAPKATRSRKPKDEPAAATPEPETQKVETPAPTGRTISDDDLRAAATVYLGMDKDAEAMKTRKGFVSDLMKHLGTAKLCGDESTLDDDGRKQAWFFIERAKLGLTSNFSADWDFDGDVMQGGGEPEEEDLGI